MKAEALSSPASIALAKDLNADTIATQQRVIADQARQIYRLQKELSESTRRIGELTVLRNADADTMLAVALRRDDVIRILDWRTHESVVIETAEEDFSTRFRPATVSLHDVRCDGLTRTLLRWAARILNGEAIEFAEEGDRG